jgi:RimJ/RimL family protein N-acetyltransferase
VISLRAVEDADLETFYLQQADPAAAKMAVFPSRDRAPFLEHWTTRILVNPDGIVRTVVADGAIAGNIISWLDPETGHRLLGYWLGREFWGRGIATEALRLFVSEVAERPLYADVAQTNVGSRRVLEKNGFRFVSSETADDGVELLLFVL